MSNDTYDEEFIQFDGVVFVELSNFGGPIPRKTPAQYPWLVGGTGKAQSKTTILGVRFIEKTPAQMEVVGPIPRRTPAQMEVVVSASIMSRGRETQIGLLVLAVPSSQAPQVLLEF